MVLLRARVGPPHPSCPGLSRHWIAARLLPCKPVCVPQSVASRRLCLGSRSSPPMAPRFSPALVLPPLAFRGMHWNYPPPAPAWGGGDPYYRQARATLPCHSPGRVASTPTIGAHAPLQRFQGAEVVLSSSSSSLVSSPVVSGGCSIPGSSASTALPCPQSGLLHCQLSAWRWASHSARVRPRHFG